MNRCADNLGYTAFALADARADFAASTTPGWRDGATLTIDPELSHRVALTHLHGEFATVLDTAAILKEAAHDVPHRIPALSRPNAA